MIVVVDDEPTRWIVDDDDDDDFGSGLPRTGADGGAFRAELVPFLDVLLGALRPRVDMMGSIQGEPPI